MTRVIFSRDRPAQLDLLLRSLDRYAPPEETVVLAREIDPAYEQVLQESGDVAFFFEVVPGEFDTGLRGILGDCGESVTFFCDDDVVFREWPYDPHRWLDEDGVLTFSLRLASRQGWWAWTGHPPHDHGYPGSIDGHMFRTADVQSMLGRQVVENPTMLEARLARRVSMFRKTRPLMASFPDQVLVGVDVNRVSDQSGVTRRATRFPQPAAELHARYMAGERIDLDALDFSGVEGCHVELPFVWSDRAAVT